VGEQSPGLGEGSGEGVGVSAEGGSGDDPPTIESLTKELEQLRSQLADRAEFDEQIGELSQQVEKQAAEVLACESRVESAKADLKYEREEYDTRVRELRKLVADRQSGQGRLPFDRPAEASPAASAGSEAMPGTSAEMVAAVIDGNTESHLPPVVDEHADKAITSLSQKSMIALVGQDQWQDAKDRDVPFGMTDKEIAVLERHDIFTVGHLEKQMRDDAYWHQNIKGFGETKVSKLIESLRIWRGKFPMPESAG
jgi:hypothetical protein